jgi:hypothetical protein
MAAEFGNEPQRVVEAAGPHAYQQEQRPENTPHAKEPISFARESIFEREAVPDKRPFLLRLYVAAWELDSRSEPSKGRKRFRSAMVHERSRGPGWTTRSLERQISTLYYEQLLATSDRTAVESEARGNLAPSQTPRDFVRDPVFLELAGC